jgi:hypothetical protein
MCHFVAKRCSHCPPPPFELPCGNRDIASTNSCGPRSGPVLRLINTVESSNTESNVLAPGRAEKQALHCVFPRTFFCMMFKASWRVVSDFNKYIDCHNKYF